MKILLSITLCILMMLSLVNAQSLVLPKEEPKAEALEIPQVVASSNQDKQWRPTEEQQKRVVSDVLAYLGAKDTRHFKEAYALFTWRQKEAVPFNRWEADIQAFYGEAGTPQGRTLKKVTWYKNPANALPGIYAAVDFSSQFADLSLHCGFVAMQPQMDGSFGVAREEENSISKREMAKITPEDLQRIRAQYRC